MLWVPSHGTEGASRLYRNQSHLSALLHTKCKSVQEALVIAQLWIIPRPSPWSSNVCMWQFPVICICYAAPRVRWTDHSGSWKGPEHSFQGRGLSLEANTKLYPLVLFYFYNFLCLSYHCPSWHLPLCCWQVPVGDLSDRRPPSPVCLVIKHAGRSLPIHNFLLLHTKSGWMLFRKMEIFPSLWATELWGFVKPPRENGRAAGQMAARSWSNQGESGKDAGASLHS